MLRALLIATPLLIAAAPPTGQDAPGKSCLNHGVDRATGQPSPAGFRRLDQLPPANEILTVIHAIDGCQKPVIVRHDIGGNRGLGR